MAGKQQVEPQSELINVTSWAFLCFLSEGPPGITPSFPTVLGAQVTSEREGSLDSYGNLKQREDCEGQVRLAHSCPEALRGQPWTPLHLSCPRLTCQWSPPARQMGRLSAPLCGLCPGCPQARTICAEQDLGEGEENGASQSSLMVQKEPGPLGF